MIRSTLFVSALGVLSAGVASGFLAGLPRQDPVSSPSSIAAEAWPICSSMGTATEGEIWAPLDADFAAGKKALAAADWNAAVTAFGSAALRDTRNADIQNYLGYAHRRLQQMDLAFRHYRQALTLNPRHRGAHRHLGEAYLAIGDPDKADAQLEALKRICLVSCDEQGDLERAIAMYRAQSMKR